MARNWLGILVVAPLALGGCLQKETTHSLYLSPDGGVVWTAFERDVRSDEADIEKRYKEEQQYLAGALAGTHGIGEGLAALGPARQRTLVLRKERPFMVMTEAAFEGIDRLVEQMLAESGIPGFARLGHDGSRTTLTIHLEIRTDSDTEIPSPVMNLFEDLDRYRIVLTSGRFVTAAGFILVDDRMAAVPRAVTEEELIEKRGVVDLSLTWETATVPTSVPRISWDRSSR